MKKLIYSFILLFSHLGHSTVDSITVSQSFFDSKNKQTKLISGVKQFSLVLPEKEYQKNIKKQLEQIFEETGDISVKSLADKAVINFFSEEELLKLGVKAGSKDEDDYLSPGNMILSSYNDLKSSFKLEFKCLAFVMVDEKPFYYFKFDDVIAFERFRDEVIRNLESDINPNNFLKGVPVTQDHLSAQELAVKGIDLSIAGECLKPVESVPGKQEEDNL